MDFKNLTSGAILYYFAIIHEPIKWIPYAIDWIIGIFIFPALSYVILKKIWEKWELSEKLDEAFSKILSGIITIHFIYELYIEINRKAHYANTEYVRTRDGYEAVGEWVSVKGPSLQNILIFSVLIIFFIWAGILRKHIKNKE